MPAIVEIKTAAAAISFAISTSFEYLFRYKASSENSITELNSSHVNTKAMAKIIIHNSVELKPRTIPAIITRNAIINCILKFRCDFIANRIPLLAYLKLFLQSLAVNFDIV